MQINALIEFKLFLRSRCNLRQALKGGQFQWFKAASKGTTESISRPTHALHVIILVASRETLSAVGWNGYTQSARLGAYRN
jgi:hypothetical protein